ncbi:MAG: CheY-like chemotaxis protein [Oceanicoccus sp.]|jgi:CheY-like chemotaxis protein
MHTCCSGEETLAFVASDASHPDVIIMAIGLPGIDGYETCFRIKAMSAIRHLPVIFLASVKDNDILSKCLDVGEDYVAKPFTEEMITAKITAHRSVPEV